MGLIRRQGSRETRRSDSRRSVVAPDTIEVTEIRVVSHSADPPNDPGLDGGVREPRRPVPRNPAGAIELDEQQERSVLRPS